jgi:hypothetical protein
MFLGKTTLLLQLRVLGFGFLQDGDVGVGVLPEGEEVLIGGAGFGGVALHNVGACEAEMDERADRFSLYNSPMGENLLKFRGGLYTLPG